MCAVASKGRSEGKSFQWADLSTYIDLDVVANGLAGWSRLRMIMVRKLVTGRSEKGFCGWNSLNMNGGLRHCVPLNDNCT